MKYVRHKLSVLLACAATCVAVLLTVQPDAAACGGFFCNPQQPVDQTAENIIFSQNEDGTVSAVVQIRYQGPAEEFAWLLPVSGAPEVGVSSSRVFSRLRSQTDPRYQLDVEVEGTCRSRTDIAEGANNSLGNNGGMNEDDATGSGVDVVDRGSVGPYDYTTISVDSADDDPAQAAVDWLTQNGYDLTDIGPERIREYLGAGMNLIAFKLTKNAQSGDIRPVRLRYPSELPMIPIKLTAVAATDDMGVRVWVLGEHRAVAKNYKSLVLNEAAINWLNPNANYNQVVSMAANEADGQGFVTQYAQSSSELSEVVFTTGDQTGWERLSQASNWSDNHGELLVYALNRFRGWDGIRQVIDEAVPLPAGVTVRELGGCPGCYYDSDDTEIDGLSPQVFIDSMEEHVIEPVQKTQELADSRPYVTRLYTTMSPQEMSLDPVFDFNARLEDVSNIHEATQTVFCSQGYFRSEAPWEVELPSGEVVRGSGFSWPLAAGSDVPAARQIRQDYNIGRGTVVEDNTGAIDDAIDQHNETFEPRQPHRDSDAACHTARPTSTRGAWLLMAGLVLGGLFGWRRRRD